MTTTHPSGPGWAGPGLTPPIRADQPRLRTTDAFADAARRADRSRATHARPRSRVGLALVVVACFVALWLGLAAPEVSPVAPPAPATVVPAVDPTGGGRGR